MSVFSNDAIYEASCVSRHTLYDYSGGCSTRCSTRCYARQSQREFNDCKNNKQNIDLLLYSK